MKQNRHTNAFTLIELLTVIAIIGVLAALLFPAIKSVLLKAETSKAQAAISGLSTAFRAYYTEYGKWPLDNTATFPHAVDGTLVKLLQGNGTLTAVTTAPYQGNPRNIVFLEFKAADLDGSGAFLDPWKKGYSCNFDVAYANSLPDPFDSTKPAITAGFLIWSAGPDGATDPNCGDPPGPYNTTPCVNKDNVKSW